MPFDLIMSCNRLSYCIWYIQPSFEKKMKTKRLDVRLLFILSSFFLKKFFLDRVCFFFFERIHFLIGMLAQDNCRSLKYIFLTENSTRVHFHWIEQEKIQPLGAKEKNIEPVAIHYT